MDVWTALLSHEIVILARVRNVLVAIIALANVNPACLGHGVSAPDELVTFCSIVSVQSLLWDYSSDEVDDLLW